AAPGGGAARRDDRRSGGVARRKARWRGRSRAVSQAHPPRSFAMRLYRLSYAALLLSLPVILAAQPVGKARYGGWGVDLKDMDTGVEAGDGFFRYVQVHLVKASGMESDKALAVDHYDVGVAIRVELRELLLHVGAAQT